ncbi:MAG: hypothetical protein WBL67_19295 [Nitrososphaeraceae archaeon]
MVKWRFSFPINGLHDVIEQKNSTLNIDGIVFHYRGGTERVGTVTTEKNIAVEEAEQESKYLINISLGKICFAFNTEASISQEGHYYVDLTNNQNQEILVKSLGIRYSSVKENSNSVLEKISSIKPGKQTTLDLALAYYKLGEYKNPLRIESFFSSMTVIVRDIWRSELLKRFKKDDVSTDFLEKKIELILQSRNSTTFDEAKYRDQWKKCYADERCSIAHGRGSKLVDSKTLGEYDEIVNIVHYWNREVIYYYIDKFQFM